MTSIGGYFQLELNDYKSVFHDNAMAVNSGRNALEYILLSNKKISKIFLPYYTCDVLLQPIKRLKYDYKFYNINSHMEPEIENLGQNEFLIYVNYFGIMNHKLHKLVKKHKNVIVDNAQAFFANPITNVPTFYSPRKFFGLPDGGLAYTNKKMHVNFRRDKSSGRFGHLLKRLEDGPEAGFNLFKQNDSSLSNRPLLKMSNITEMLLRNINYKPILKRRNENFIFLHNHLRTANELTPIIEKERINGPMVYPFLKKGNKKNKKQLIKNKIYIATYWPNVYEWTLKNSWEYYLAENLIPLPIDQRYSISEMKLILKML